MFSRTKRSFNIRNIGIVFTIIALLSSLIIFSLRVEAQDTGGSGLSISPTRSELSLVPGTADTIVVSIRNITSGPIIAQVFVNDFEPDNETGEPRLVTDPNRKNAASISDFLSSVDDVLLEPGEAKDVVVDVAIPNEAAPGGYYGALRFKAIPASRGTSGAGNEVSLTANLLSLVLIEVPGDITEKVAIKGVSAYLNAANGSVFTSKPNFIGVEIENLGNSFIKPFGGVKISDFSGNVIFNYELNDANPRSNVLPNSIRIFKDRLENEEIRTVNGQEVTNYTSPIKWPGRYNISADISYGNGGQVFSVTSTFWYLPSWFLIASLLLVVTLVALIYFLYKKYTTKFNRR